MPVPRRALLAALAAAAATTALGGCGFALRQPAALPFTRLAVSGFAPAAPMADALRQALPRSVQWVDDPRQAERVLVVLEDRLTRTVAASTAGGQVREFRLRVTLRFRLDRPDGTPLLPETQLELTRDMSYSETAALAKQTEEAVLLRDMRLDMAHQLLEMLAASGRAPSA